MDAKLIGSGRQTPEATTARTMCAKWVSSAAYACFT